MVMHFFDRAAAPSAATARQMLGELRGTGVHVYLGGPRSAGSGWTPQLIRAYVAAGITSFLLTYVGRQGQDRLSAAIGKQDAADACTLAARFGWTRGAPICLDVENHTFEAQRSQALAYAGAWSAHVAAQGFRAGVYSSVAALTALAARPDRPDFVWAAKWVRHDRGDIDPSQIPGLPAAAFGGRAQRAWQYAAEFDGEPCRLRGLDVDLDVAAAGLLVGPPGRRPRLENLLTGRRNVDVRIFQERLRAIKGGKFARLNPSGATGFYGDETRAMCAAFQRDQGFTGQGADGLAGPVTVDRLFR